MAADRGPAAAPEAAARGARPIGTADLHVHPCGDPPLHDAVDRFAARLVRTPLSVVAITDHDTIDAALVLAARAADGAFGATEVVVGIELTTADGHLLGYGLREAIEPGRPLADSVAAVHAQGGLALVSHPGLPTAISARFGLLRELSNGARPERPDGLEAYNPMAAWLPGYRALVARRAATYGYAVVGGSDAHRSRDVGRGVTRFPGASASDLAAAIRDRTTVATGRPYRGRQVARGIRGQIELNVIALARRLGLILPD